MNKPNRKRNRLIGFDYTQTYSYFITMCTNHRARLFFREHVGNGLCAVPSSPLSNRIVHKWIRETQNKFPHISIDRYVIMEDHIHLIITIHEQRIDCSLQDVMQFFKTMTTNEYIRGVKEGLLPAFQNKLWQKSFHDHIIRNQQDYRELWNYIDGNPIRDEAIRRLYLQTDD